MSVNNSIFQGDYFKLKFQMLHLGMDVLYVIWSTTIGKIVSGHSLDSCFFFLVIFPFVASPFILSFFWKVFICSAKGDTPLDPSFFSLLLSFLCFASHLFTFRFFAFFSLCEISILFVLTIAKFVGCNCRITERKIGFFALQPNMFSRSEASTLQRTELNYVLPPPVFRSTNASLRSATTVQAVIIC